MVLLRPLLLFALMLPAFGKEPMRKDPFLAPDDEIRAMIPREPGPVQMNVQLDWIRLPHMTAHQLIRQHLKRTNDGGPLYKAVQELIAQKKAERLDITSTLVRSEQRSKIESVVEHPYPTEFDPAQLNKRVIIDGNPGGSLIAPVAASAFATKALGRTFEVEATVSKDLTWIDLSLAPEWHEHLGDITYGAGASKLTQPIFGTTMVTTQMLVKNGEWQMAGLLTPPHGAPEGKLYASVEALPAERVLLFVRANVDAPANPPDTTKPAEEEEQEPVGFVNISNVHQVTVLAEWIEVDAATAAGLLAKHPAYADSIAIRDALEPLLLNGQASLLESSALQIRGGQRSKVQSVTEFPYPTEFDPPQIPYETVESLKKADPPLQPPPPIPATASSFATKKTGATMEVEATVGEDHFTVDLNLSPELIFNLGAVTYGQGASAIQQPKFQTMKTSFQLITFPNSPVIIGSYDAPLREGQHLPTVQTRKVLLFVRAIL